MGRDGGQVALVGECKFHNQRFGKQELDKLIEKIALLPMRMPKIVLFSLGGFTQEVLDEDLLAVDIDTMYDRTPTAPASQ